jgi:hypothetical protein
MDTYADTCLSSVYYGSHGIINIIISTVSTARGPADVRQIVQSESDMNRTYEAGSVSFK